MSIVVRDKDGNRKKIAGAGLPGKNAYQYAVEGGFKGTEQEFAALQGQISNPNLLDNWYFVDPINQRGLTEYNKTAGMVYTIDRWLGDRNENALLFTVDNGFITIKSGTVWFGQFIDAGNINDWLGKTYTLSVLLANGEFYSGQATPVSTQEDHVTAFRYKDGGECYLQFLWGNDKFLFCLWSAAGGSVLQNDLSVVAAKLELGSVQTLARGYTVKYTDAWCSAFASAVAIAAELTDIIPTECGCERHIQLFKALGSWQENDAYVPAPGDYVFYDWDDRGAGDCTGAADHVGIVEKVSGTKITVIEGNISDSVGRRTLTVNGRYIRGYGVPKYGAKTAGGGVSSTASVTAPTTTAARTYTVRSGDSLWAIAAKQLGSGTRYPEIETLNGLKSDTIHPGQVLKLPE